MKLIYLWLFSLASAYKYLQCNESQHSYFYAERELFGVASHETPFFNKGDFEEIQYIPTTCVNKNDVLYDDTDNRPGQKFATHDLIGSPWQIIVGSKKAMVGLVELKHRKTGEKEDMPVESAIAKILGEFNVL